MKNIKFTSMTIDNFKGVPLGVVKFCDGVTVLSGANYSGKTTRLDALNWVLFGKTLDDVARFGINPITNATAEPHVSLDLVVDGVEHKIERYARAKGTVCYIDGVKTAVGEYVDWANENLLQIERFKMFSNPLFFASMDWNKQRDTFMRYFESPPKEQVYDSMKTDKIDMTERFLDLMQKISPSDISIRMKDEIDGIERSEISERAVASHIASELSMTTLEPLPDLEKKRDALTKKWEKQAQSQQDAEKKRREYNDRVYEARQILSAFKADYDLEKSLAIRALREQKDELLQKIAVSKRNVTQYGEDWKALIKEGVKALCPLCKRVLPNADDNQKLYDEQKAVIEDGGKKARAELEMVEAEIALLPQTVEPTEAMKAIESDIEEAREALEKIEADEPKIETVDVSELRMQIDSIGKQISGHDEHERKEKQLKEIMERLEGYARQKEERQRIGNDAKQYILYEAKVAVELVNAKFDGVRFELYEILKDGTPKPTFKIVYRGKEYADTSKTEKVLAGIEINKFLKTALDVNVPTIIDDFESFPSIDPATLPSGSIITIADKGAQGVVTVTHINKLYIDGTKTTFDSK